MDEVINPIKGDVLTDEQAMRLAITEAYKGAGRVSPNPLVGCVILDGSNRFLSQGYHQKYGEAHAEINALKDLKEQELQGARVFVTLEPCAHQGKTPSCAKKLATLPIKEVIYGLQDPNPLVAGKGAQILQEAKIQATLFSGLQTELEEVCEVFLYNQRKQATFVSLKVATSLDGQMALKNGESKWITGSEARTHAHFLRATHEGILVGAKTVLVDNPSLDIRHADFVGKSNKVFILDVAGECVHFLKDSKLMQTHGAEDVYVVVPDSYKLDGQDPCQILRVKVLDGAFDLSDLLRQMWDFKVYSLLVEGGAQVLSSFIKSQNFQRLHLFMAPKIMGAAGSLAWTSHFSINHLADSVSLVQLQSISMGEDIYITAKKGGSRAIST